jgi:hypothetical protein
MFNLCIRRALKRMQPNQIILRLRQMEHELNRKTKSVKPMITWVDLEDEADALLDMELKDESQKTESALEDIKSL